MTKSGNQLVQQNKQLHWKVSCSVAFILVPQTLRPEPPCTA